MARKEKAGQGREVTEGDPEDPKDQGRWISSNESVVVKFIYVYGWRVHF